MPRTVNLDGYNLSETAVAEILRVIDARTIGSSAIASAAAVSSTEAPQLLGADGLIAGSFQRGVRAPIPAVGGPAFNIADVAIEAGAPTLSMVVGRNGLPALRVQGAVGTTVEIKFPGMQNTYSGGDAYLLIDGSLTRGNLATATSYVSQDAAGYAKGWNCQVSYGYANPVNNPYEQGGVVTYWFKRNNNINFGAPTYPAFVADHKLRLVPNGATALDVTIYGYGFADRRPKSRGIVGYDDGYSSSMQLGYEMFASRGIPLTMGVIGSNVGTANYASLAMLKAFVNAGNVCVAHGPWPSGGAGNLFTAYPGSTNPFRAALDDMLRNRDYLAKNNLLVAGADRCYVWPQGVWQQVANDTTLLDMAIAEGFTFGRSATPVEMFNSDALSKYNRMTVPIIGHTWGGTTANEATNIAAIQTTMDLAVTHRADWNLMLHRVMPQNTSDGGMGAGGNITIRHDDAQTLATKIKTLIDAGTMEAVTMAQMACSPQSLWATA